jgi:hypothetical protein
MSRSAKPAKKEKLPTGEVRMSTEQIVWTLEGYRIEAEDARKQGYNPRDDKWRENLDMYWNRWDFRGKAKWQSKNALPEVPGYVDRFSAAMKEALVSSPEGFYVVRDPVDKEGDLTSAVKKVEDVWLSRCGRNAGGDPLAFAAVFEEQMKLGCLSACSAVVLWKEDVPFGRVAVESLDPRSVWLDHTYRGLYRIRRTEIDRHEIARMATLRDGSGKPIYNLPELERLVAKQLQEEETRAAEITGGGTKVSALGRNPIVLDEYYADIISPRGHLEYERALAVVANREFLIRAPEPNPFLHGRDWVLFAPLVPVPLSPYGRSYMEDFGSIARALNELTNLILDAVQTAAMKAFVMVPSMLLNPQQAAEGVAPNKLFLLEEGFRAEDFMKELELGSVDASSVQVWQALKQELVEAAKLNEIGLGQFAPKGRTSATEITETLQNSSAIVRSVADTVENTFLNPLLDLVWKTGMQHASAKDPALIEAAGAELWPTILQFREELAGRRLTFQAQGISRLIERSRMLRALIQILQVISSNEMLLAQFLQVVDLQLLIKVLFELSNVDLSRLQVSERQNLIRQVAQPIVQAGERANSASAGQPIPGSVSREAGDVARIVNQMGGSVR